MTLGAARDRAARTTGIRRSLVAIATGGCLLLGRLRCRNDHLAYDHISTKSTVARSSLSRAAP